MLKLQNLTLHVKIKKLHANHKHRETKSYLSSVVKFNEKVLHVCKHILIFEDDCVTKTSVFQKLVLICRQGLSVAFFL